MHTRYQELAVNDFRAAYYINDKKAKVAFIYLLGPDIKGPLVTSGGLNG